MSIPTIVIFYLLAKRSGAFHPGRQNYPQSTTVPFLGLAISDCCLQYASYALLGLVYVTLPLYIYSTYEHEPSQISAPDHDKSEKKRLD
ncbi:hypothetical protein BU24DRAFT_422751 [Aaosphaeria arxii CBS 175.79]|uniref:Uncharacterized protein n=1 Tax=Aaosphaeria arxii CBS 175.79 TaxID=1450172 RepID=A0A6A5XT78_9PLEO|nr:uncharacterized protein BU24DRAFT_422751 [Aaosphaeria arxii CBS 175.79]KAF2016412.1 hypothetical protein BU24DRAFT_422751 [Aaosphaeria arxii CBS 175.79]